jgi:hypothetical protein
MPRQVTPSRPNGVARQRRCPAYARRRLTDELIPPAARTLARMGQRHSARYRAALLPLVPCRGACGVWRDGRLGGDAGVWSRLGECPLHRLVPCGNHCGPSASPPGRGEMAWIGWAERVEDSRPVRTALHQSPEPAEVRHVDGAMRLPLLRMVRGAARAAARTGRPAADLEAQLLALLRRAPARNELAAPAVLASPHQIAAHPGCHGAAVKPRNPRARIERLDRASALAAAPADAPQHLPRRRPARIPRVAHAADEPARHPAVTLAQIAEIPLHGHDAAVRQEALFAVHDQRGNILKPAIREAVEGRLETLDVDLAHRTNIGQPPCPSYPKTRVGRR